jgi:plasmid stability protein
MRVPTVQITGVPDDVHRTLRARAAASGQSLHDYLLARLVEAAREEPLESVLARAGGRSGGSVDLAFATDAVRDDRDAGPRALPRRPRRRGP